MAFPAATYNLTFLGSSSLSHPYILRNLPDFIQFSNQTRVHFSEHLIPSILNSTEDRNMRSLLEPIQSRLQQISTTSQSNVLRRTQSSVQQKQSFITKRSHNSRKSRSKPKARTPSDTPTESSTLEPAVESATNEVHTTVSGIEDEISTVPQTDETVHLGGHVPLMDPRSPEHADRFESSRVRGPLAVKTSTTSEAPVVVTPRMALPSPSPDALMQLPVLWTALSLALGVEVQGEIVRGLPCIKRLNQLFCRNAGTSYPSDNIETFIDDNKALTRRMYGDFQSDLGLGEIVESAIRSLRSGRSVGEDPLTAHNYTNVVRDNVTEALQNLDVNLEDLPGADTISTYLGPGFYSTFYDEEQSMAETPGGRSRRQAGGANAPGGNRRPSVPSVPAPPTRTSNSDRLDSCNSKMEIVTPYWASNSAGKILAIVNLNEFSQVIHQEVCTRSSTKRCNGECGCEQKYKWHRMLAYDLENECKGIFVDWFLFPSCCVCRCDP